MKIKHFLPMLLTIMLLFSNLVVMSAAGVSQIGSITLKVTQPEGSIVISPLNLYKVADATVTQNGIAFQWVSPFKDDSDLTDSGSLDNNLAERLAAIAVTAVPLRENVTFDSSGIVKFDNLEAGLYLFTQKSSQSGYNEISPFLVTVPRKNTDGTLTYSVNVEPKVAVAYVSSVPTTSSMKISDKSLPQTGQIWWPIVPLTIIGSLLLSVGILMRYGNEKYT